MNCNLCLGLFTPTAHQVQLCPNCDSNVPLTLNKVQSIDNSASPRFYIQFFGWPSTFNEWVNIKRLTSLEEHTPQWLKIGSIICYCTAENTYGESSQMDKYLMARIMDVRRSETSGFEVKIQVDTSLPFSFPSPVRPTPTQEELNGIWIPMTSGRIKQSGSFAPGYR